jgi:hypothetical protein
MSCEIIQFSGRINRTTSAPGLLRPMEKRTLPEPLTETCKNARLRAARQDAWRHAGRATDYWRARLNWQAALEWAQKREIADSASFPSAAKEDRGALVRLWRDAVAKQLLTPAPDVGAVTWKRAKLEGRDFSYIGIEQDRVERAIADDVAFLEAHPTRRSIAASRQSSGPEQEQ